VPVRDLARANGLDDVNWVPAGRLLSIPPVGPSVSAGVPSLVVNASAGHYKVREGDSLSDIAISLGVPLGQLAAANGIANPNFITVGQLITAPNVWECPAPSAAFVNDYGYVRPDGHVHAGVDLFAPRGTPIYAPVGGTAERYPNPSGGNGLELYGNDGNRYYFAHLDAYGDTGSVSAGTVVGYVGNTGDARGGPAHDHFEWHPYSGATIDWIGPYGHTYIDSGTTLAVDPFPYLRDACTV
jgi:murein DD-endopeptidase MepM/ murein hydrolase activator NlpD